MKFKIGQEVVCIRPNKPWIPRYGPAKYTGPKYLDIVTISMIHPNREFVSGSRGPALEFFEWSERTFNARWFEPLITTKELNEALESIPKLETV